MCEAGDKDAYKRTAERKDHSDTLYYTILNSCILTNSALGAGAAAVLRTMNSLDDLVIIGLVSCGGLILTSGFNKYLQNEKEYQDSLQQALPIEVIPSGYPDIFHREKGQRSSAVPRKWSQFPFWFAIFWVAVICFSTIRYFGWIYNG